MTAEPQYQEDLAYIHDQGFTRFAETAAVCHGADSGAVNSISRRVPRLRFRSREQHLAPRHVLLPGALSPVFDDDLTDGLLAIGRTKAAVVEPPGSGESRIKT